MVREARHRKGHSGQQTLSKVGLLGPNTLQAEDTPNISVSIELEAGEKPVSAIGSVGARIGMIPLSD